MSNGLMINNMPTADDLISSPWVTWSKLERERTITGYPFASGVLRTGEPFSYDLARWKGVAGGWSILNPPSPVRLDPALSTSEAGPSSYGANACFGLFLFAWLAASTTGDSLTALRSIYRAYTHDDQQESAETGYGICIRFVGLPSRPMTFERSSAAEQTEMPATLIRQHSGLDVDDLATIFRVSRTSYHQWLSGTRPRATHAEHLLEVLPLIQDVATRLQGISATRDWLLSPSLPDGERPVNLLREREYDSFRGALLRTPTGHERVRLLSQTRRVGRAVTQAELADGLSRIRSGDFHDNSDTDDRDG